MMTHAVGIVLLVMCLVVHEAGHAIAMTRRKIEIKRVSIGLPMPRRLRLNLKPKRLPYPIQITPFLLGAFVEPSPAGQERMSQMGYRERAICMSAGILMNLSFAGVLLLVATTCLAVDGDNDMSTTRLAVLSLVAAALTVVPILFRHFLAVTMPLYGLLSTAGLAYLIFNVANSVSGPIGTISISASANNWADAFGIGGSISLSLALFNMILLVPLDGGKITVALLESISLRRLGQVYSVVSALGFLALLGYVINK